MGVKKEAMKLMPQTVLAGFSSTTLIYVDVDTAGWRLSFRLPADAQAVLSALHGDWSRLVPAFCDWRVVGQCIDIRTSDSYVLQLTVVQWRDNHTAELCYSEPGMPPKHAVIQVNPSGPFTSGLIVTIPAGGCWDHAAVYEVLRWVDLVEALAAAQTSLPLSELFGRMDSISLELNFGLDGVPLGVSHWLQFLPLVSGGQGVALDGTYVLDDLEGGLRCRAELDDLAGNNNEVAFWISVQSLQTRLSISTGKRSDGRGPTLRIQHDGWNPDCAVLWQRVRLRRLATLTTYNSVVRAVAQPGAAS